MQFTTRHLIALTVTVAIPLAILRHVGCDGDMVSDVFRGSFDALLAFALWDSHYFNQSRSNGNAYDAGLVFTLVLLFPASFIAVTYVLVSVWSWAGKGGKR